MNDYRKNYNNNYVLRARSDGRVNCDRAYGIFEGKCSHLYRDLDLKLVNVVSKNPCIVYDKNTDTIRINRNHICAVKSRSSYPDVIFYEEMILRNNTQFCSR